MAVLVTSYWGESTTEDLRLRHLYESARDNLAPRFNSLSEGVLEVYDLEWLPDGNLEDFLVRGTSAAERLEVGKLVDLVALLTDERRSIGTGLAIYGRHSSLYASDVRRQIDRVRPTGLRFVAHEYSADDFGGHIGEWLMQAANEAIMRAKVTDSERLIRHLTNEQPETVIEQSWYMI